MPRSPRRARAGPASTLLGVLGGVLLVLLVVVALVVILSRGEGGLDASPTLSAPEVEVATPTSPRPAPTSEEQADTASVLVAEREPEEADAAAFAGSYDPPGGREVESVTIDLDGDGRLEVVVASIVDEVSRLDVASWDGRRYVVSFTGQGGPAEVVDEFTVRDVTGDGRREILLVQHGEDRHSLALWGVTPDGVARQAARGGCWDGSHVYGQQGAEVDDGELVATCDPTAADVAGGRQGTYRWDGEAWVVHQESSG